MCVSLAALVHYRAVTGTVSFHIHIGVVAPGRQLCSNLNYLVPVVLQYINAKGENEIYRNKQCCCCCWWLTQFRKQQSQCHVPGSICPL